MRRSGIAFLVALVGAAGWSVRGDVPPAAEKSEGQRLTIVAINDTHGALLAAPPPKWISKHTRDPIGGADWFAGYVETIRAEAKEKGGEVLVLDGGDAFQGTMISNQFGGRSVTEVYNAVGVSAAALGNHEFDFGMRVLKQRIAQAKYPLLSANVFLKGTRQRPEWLRPSVLLELRGLKVGIIGLTTQETPLSTNPLMVEDLEFAEGGPAAAEEADALRARGATVVLICAHAGPLPPENEIQRIAESVRGKVDAIVSGHHHVALGPPPLVVAGIPIVQSGSRLQSFSVIDLSLDGGGRVRSFAVNQGSLPGPGGPQAILHTFEGRPAEWRGRRVEPDPRVAAILRRYDAEVSSLRETPIGESAVELRKGDRDDLLGNLAADALRSGAGGSLKAQFALQNAGGLRVTEIPAGPITYGQIFDLYPFDNYQVLVSLPADLLRDALEVVLRAGKAPMRVSGLRYAIDWEKFGASRNPKTAPAGAIVVRLLDENRRVLCETRSCTATRCESSCAPGMYSVSVTDFLANGGDGLTMLKGAEKRLGTLTAREIIVAYVKEHRPLTASLLGAASTGREPRWTQVGSPRGREAGE
jgi:5'-nucleotidase